MTHQPPRLTPWILTVLGLLAATSSLATDLYLSSVPTIAADLQTTPAQAQLTLSLFFFGICLGQLLLGPLSDSRGRRPVLLVSLAVFTAAGVATIFVPNIETLTVLRFVQGASGAAGLVLSRAIAVDLSTGDTAVRALSLIQMVVGLGPLLAPPLGASMHTLIGWRGVLATLATVALLLLILTWRSVPESLPPEKRLPQGIIAAIRPSGRLLRDPGFVLLMLAFSLGFAAMIAYVSASPFVGQRVLGMTPLVYGLAFATSASAFLIANFVNARLAPRIGPAAMLAVAAAVLVLGGGGLLALTLGDALTAPTFITCAFSITAGAALTMSNGSALALARAGAARGSGSALIGAVQFGLGGAMAPLVGLWGEHTALPMAVAASVAAVLTAVSVALSRRFTRSGD